ncbi:MAG: hypothetical protein JXR03_15705 [Cyclobacteriaceae bacterium]
MNSDRIVLLARPSSLLIENMKRLMESASLSPEPLRSLEKMGEYNQENLAAIVISTAISSPVKESYCEVVERSKELFSGTPIFLASYANIRRTKLIAETKFKERGIKFELISTAEAKGLNVFDARKTIVIITKEDLEDEEKFLQTVDLVKKVVQ